MKTNRPWKINSGAASFAKGLQSGFAHLGGEAAEVFSEMEQSTSGDAPKHPERKEDDHPAAACTMHTPVLPQIPEQIRKLVDRTCASKGGAERMTLGDWREAEQEVKRRLDHEYSKI